MKISVFISLVLVLIVLFLHMNTYMEVPKVEYKESLDNHIGPIDISNAGFFLDKNSDIGVLLVHGLGATTYQTRLLADFLAERNISVYSVRLSGHGTNVADLEGRRWSDWYYDVEEGYYFIKSQTKNVYVIGVSSGGSMALYLAGNHNLDGVVSIGTPIYMQNTKIYLAPIISFFKRYQYSGVDKSQIGHAYENTPISTLVQFSSMTSIVSHSLEKVDDPILIIQSKKDSLVVPESADYIYDKVHSQEKKIIWVNSINHAIIRVYDDDTEESDEERQKVFNEIYDFITI